MGSTSPQTSTPSVPNQIMPYVNQASTLINNLPQPNVSSSQAGQAASALATDQFSPSGSISNLQNFYNTLMSGSMLNPASNPYLQSVLNSNMMQFQKALGSGLDASNAAFNLAGQGPGSSVAQGTQAQMVQNALENFTNQTGSMLFGNYNTGIQQMLAALGMGNPVASSIQSAYQAATAPQLQQLSVANMPIQDLISLIGGTPLATTQYGPSEFAQNFGMGIQGIGALANLGTAAAKMGYTPFAAAP